VAVVEGVSNALLNSLKGTFLTSPFEKEGLGDLKILTEAPNPLKGAKH
jgi:hypothetical protein